MPKTFPIMIEVEEIALGQVLRKLNDMPGIAKLHLDLGRGGQGAGKKELEHAAVERASGTGNAQQITVKLLMTGPKHINQISAAVGGHKTRAYGVMTQLRKQGLAESAPGVGMHQLTKRAMAEINRTVSADAPAATLALPAPAKKQRDAKGKRLPRGSANVVLKKILAEGPKTPEEVRAKAAETGMPVTSIKGMIDRAKRDGLIKKNGVGLELTAKGLKIETGVAANG